MSSPGTSPKEADSQIGNRTSTSSVESQSAIENLLTRPLEQRLREYKYRCAQSIVFGLPVIALQFFGHRLGGPEAERWIAVFQSLLAGWVMYVGAAGMLFEGMLRLRHALTPDLLIAAIAVGLYLFSLVAVLALPLTGQIAYRPLLFHVVVIVLAAWSAIRWLMLKAKVQQ